MATFDYMLGNEMRGPVGPAIIRKLAKDGAIGPETPLKRTDSPHWKKAGEFAGLFESPEEPKKPQEVPANDPLPFTDDEIRIDTSGSRTSSSAKSSEIPEILVESVTTRFASSETNARRNPHKLLRKVAKTSYGLAWASILAMLWNGFLLLDAYIRPVGGEYHPAEQLLGVSFFLILFLISSATTGMLFLLAAWSYGFATIVEHYELNSE